MDCPYTSQNETAGNEAAVKSMIYQLLNINKSVPEFVLLKGSHSDDSTSSCFEDALKKKDNVNLYIENDKVGRKFDYDKKSIQAKKTFRKGRERIADRRL